MEQKLLFKIEDMGGVSLEDGIEAYYDCRRRKRNTANAIEFELDYERYCIDLWQELNEHRYKPRRSIAFIVEYPVKREIFAADFRDRVVHHLIARRIYGLLEQQFHTDSYSTQKGKGTLYGIKRLEKHIYDCSEGYTKDCWIMKLDISGFFMNIPKDKLYDTVCRFLECHYHENDKQMLYYMLEETIYNRPECNCIRKVPRWRWHGLPKNKSLFGSHGKKGLPIGNLTSQLLALLYLDELDHLVTGPWGVQHFGRYVDDMALVHPSPQHLLGVRHSIISYLSDLNLKLHPKKMYLQHYSKGVMFVGGMIKPGRKYISNRTVARLFAKIHYYNQRLALPEPLTDAESAGMMASMNSYLGMMRHYNADRLFRRMLYRIERPWYRYCYISKRGRRVKLVVKLHTYKKEE